MRYPMPPPRPKEVAVTAQELRAWRERRSLTQEQAERWYFGHSNDGRTWRRYERGERAIPPPLVQRIRTLDGAKRRR